jgi:hypothetical protein
MSFRIFALPSDRFASLFSLTDESLNELGVVRKIADAKPGFPCRVSLVDAEIGETVLLLNYEHQPAPTPFRASHAIYVREGALQAQCAIGEVPNLLRTRMISLRGFDEGHMLIAAELAHGRELETSIQHLFENDAVSYLHLHYAKPGCYAARVERDLST